MSPGSTGRMIPKPIASPSTAMKTKSRAPRPALGELIQGLSWERERAILYEGLRRLAAKQQHRRARRAQRDLGELHQVLGERGDRGALEKQPLHEARHV